MSGPQILKHMMPRDIPLWATYFFSPEGQHYTAWEFDVLVGDPQHPGYHFPPEQIRQALYLNCLKIDAVGWLFSTPTLIECKPKAGLGALGQVDGYQEWYRIIFGIKPRGLIVCEEMSRQVETLCMLKDIQVVRVRPANDATVSQAIAQVRALIQKLSVLPAIQAVA